ncbi:MAG: hypothetical protein WGN25_15610 [Candidatus Electrothrix sp. GW3-4]|uniref:two-CW domain-containing protein n=1 Tax=Candidatus Electrothrix sp. GW3-4 TaxID=3126740 RepID=UPI0030D587D3
MNRDNLLNCWQFKKCGREPGGKNAVNDGVCSVALDIGADGVHNGTNGGRCCWVITNSAYQGDRDGFCLEKSRKCRECDFYLFIKKSEKLFFAA